MTLPLRIVSGIGVLEYWSVGKSKSLDSSIIIALSLPHCSMTPLLQETSALKKDQLWEQPNESYSFRSPTLESLRLGEAVGRVQILYVSRE